MDQENSIYASKEINIHYHVTLFTVTMVIIRPKVKVKPTEIITLKSSKSTESKAIFLLFFYLWGMPITTKEK